MLKPLIEVKNLKKHYSVKDGLLRAVNDVSFSIMPKETFGLVGESGCGKSTIGKLLLRLINPTEGDISFQGESIHSLDDDAIRVFRQKAQIIFQDPYSSLNPRMTAGEIIKEPLVIHGVLKPHNTRRDTLHELLNMVGLDPSFENRYPHEFSGGQRQRIGIARALALNPRFVVCDEPIAALDVSIQAQIVNLLSKLQNNLGLTYLFISHDLAMVRHLCTRIAVMYLGEIVEIADRNDLYERPLHPYTKGLLSAIPIPDPLIERKRTRVYIKGEIPSSTMKTPGCPFYSRCPKAMDICRHSSPRKKEMSPSHFVRCHLY